MDQRIGFVVEEIKQTARALDTLKAHDGLAANDTEKHEVLDKSLKEVERISARYA